VHTTLGGLYNLRSGLSCALINSGLKDVLHIPNKEIYMSILFLSGIGLSHRQWLQERPHIPINFLALLATNWAMVLYLLKVAIPIHSSNPVKTRCYLIKFIVVENWFDKKDLALF